MSSNLRRPFTSRINLQPLDNSWLVILLIILLVFFWGFAVYVEGVDGILVQEWLRGNAVLSVLADLPALPWIFSFFHIKVLRHFVPVAVGWYFAYDAAVVLVRMLYDLPDRAGAQRFLSRLRGSNLGGSVPEVTPGSLAIQRHESVLLRVGGPGQVRVPPGHVLVTELNGRYQRILPAGKHKLGRYEYIHAALDLQPQERVLDEFAAFSRDGIELRVGLSIVYRLKMGSQVPTRENPYPYDETAVRTAAYAQTVIDDRGTISTWEDTPINMAKGTLTAILAGFRLDEIIAPERAGEEPYRTLRNELLRQLRLKLDNLGIDLQAVGIHRIDLPTGVNEQYIDYWKSHWESQMLLNMIDGEATAVEEMEIAQAEAEIMMIQAIQEGIQRAKREGATAHMEEVVALRLVEALEKMARQSQRLSPLPNTLLPQLDGLRKQLSSGNFDPRSPGESPSMSQEPIQQSYDNNSQIRTAVNRLTELLEWLYPDPSPDIFTVRDYRNRYPFTRLGALATDDIDRYQRINRAIGNHVQIGLCECHIGLIYLHEADFHGAVQQFELARQQWSFVSQPAAVSLTHLARAVALQFAHHYEAALVSVGRVAGWLERSRFAKPVPGWPDFETRVMAYVAELQGQLRKQMECESKTAESTQEEAAAEEPTPDEPVVNDELDTSEHPITHVPDPEAETRPDGEIITGAPTPAPIVNLTKSDANKPIPGHQQINQKYQWYVVEVRPSSQFMPDINHGDWLLVDMTPNFPHDVRDTEQPILIVKKEEIDDTIRVRPLAAEQRFPRIYLVTLADSLTGSFWRDEVTGTVTFAQERGKIDVNSSEILGVVVGYWRPMYAQSSAG